MNTLLDQRVASFDPQAATVSNLEVRHLLIGACGTHSLKANGVYQVARALADEQRAAGANARLLLLREANSVVPDEDSDPDLEIVLIEGPKILGKRVGLSHAVLERLTGGANERTIFHIHTARQPLLIALTRALRTQGIPYVVTVHGRYSHVYDESMRVKHRLPALYLRIAERWALERARFVQAVASGEQAIIRAIAPKARVELIPNSVISSREGTQPRKNAQRACSSKFPVFGFLGRYEIEHKGLDLLLEGFERYRRAGGHGTLALVGSGPQRQELLARASASPLLADVTIDGPQYGNDKIRTMSSWDYFVSPSRFDGLPLATLEAALLGTPILVTAETGLQQSVLASRSGFAIESLDPDAVASAFFAAERASPSQWRAMSEAAHEMALSFGDWASISNKMLDLYRQS